MSYYTNHVILDYKQILQKLVFRYLSTGCFVEFALLSSGLSIDDFSKVLIQ